MGVEKETVADLVRFQNNFTSREAQIINSDMDKSAAAFNRTLLQMRSMGKNFVMGRIAARYEAFQRDGMTLVAAPNHLDNPINIRTISENGQFRVLVIIEREFFVPFESKNTGISNDAIRKMALGLSYANQVFGDLRKKGARFMTVEEAGAYLAGLLRNDSKA